MIKARILLLALLCGVAVSARAQDARDEGSLPFVFASAAQARAVLGAPDDFTRATAPLERAARLKSAEPVSEGRLMQYMADAARDWTDVERRRLEPLLAPLSRFLAGVKSRHPPRILLILATSSFEERLPFTRANAIVIPASYVARNEDLLAALLAHEAFHILTRTDDGLKNRLYESIGFRRCASVTLPSTLTRLRFTNPDAVENRHTIAVRYRAQAVEALPYVRFALGEIDPRRGFSRSLVWGWLLVERDAGNCRVGTDWTGHEVATDQLEGLYQQIGRNTTYLVHPEEILADNFEQLFMTTRRGSVAKVRSPEILEQMRKILFGP